MFSKNCPKCESKITFTSNDHLLRSIKRNAVCKKCSAGYIDNLKMCMECKEIKKDSEYYKTTKGRCRAICIICSSQISKRMYIKNKDKIIKQQKEYQATGKGIINSKKYRETYRDEIRKRRYWEKWRIENPEKSRASNRKRREKVYKLDANFTYELEILIRDKFNSQCFNCNSKNNLCIDHHRPLSKGYGLSEKNAVLLCKSCNSSKGAKNPENFYNLKQLDTLNKLGIK